MFRALQYKIFSLTYVVGGNITHRNMQKETWVSGLVLVIWGILCDPVRKGFCKNWRYFKRGSSKQNGGSNVFIRQVVREI